MTDAITIWRFDEAPDELRRLSQHGGDEDWLAIVPPHLVDVWVPWMEEGTGGFGVAGVSEHPHPTWQGWVVRIGAHA